MATSTDTHQVGGDILLEFSPTFFVKESKLGTLSSNIPCHAMRLFDDRISYDLCGCCCIGCCGCCSGDIYFNEIQSLQIVQNTICIVMDDLVAISFGRLHMDECQLIMNTYFKTRNEVDLVVSGGTEGISNGPNEPVPPKYEDQIPEEGIAEDNEETTAMY